MTAAALSRSARKEIRALLPTWTACAIGIAAPALLSDHFLPVAMLAFGLGSIALGAQSMGQEYGQRTLGLLLSQPVSRASLFLVKQAVLAAMLTALAVGIWLRVSGPGHPDFAGALVLMVALSSLFLAPALTMATGSGIAGMVFTIGVPLLLLLGANLAGMARYGSFAAAQIDALTTQVLWRGMTIVLMASVIGSWWMFHRIEAIDGRGREVRLPRWLARGHARPSTMRRQHPVRQLIVKELHIQQLPFVVSFLCLLAIGIMAVRGYLDPEASEAGILPIVMLNMMALPVLVGALASAEERQQGTLQWQLLLPMAAWKQWTVKVAVALSLALVLGIVVPALVLWGLGLPFHQRVLPMGPVAVVLLVSLSLYVSSLSSSGIRALLISIPSIVAGGLAIQWTGFKVWLLVRDFGWVSDRSFGWMGPRASVWSASIAALVLSALLLYMGSRNHRSFERPRAVLQRQVPVIAGTVIVLIVLLTLLGVR